MNERQKMAIEHIRKYAQEILRYAQQKKFNIEMLEVDAMTIELWCQKIMEEEEKKKEM